MKPFSVGSFVLVFLSLTACSSAPDPSDGSTRSALNGGDSPSVRREPKQRVAIPMATIESSSATCTKEECGPEPGVPSQICPDGSVAGPVCERRKDGTCGYDFRTCPAATTCTPESCGTPPYGAPNYVCPNGKIAGPVCEPSNGVCAWRFETC